MLKTQKIEANLATLAGFAAILGALLEPDLDEGLRVGLVVAGDILFLLGCGLYARSKGCSFAWGLIVPLGFACIAVCWFYIGEYQKTLKWTGVILTVLGLLVLAFLPDRHRWGV